MTPRGITAKAWEHWLERLYDLRRDKRGSHERPHKPVLLLSVLDLLDEGAIAENRIPLSKELVRSFRRYFDVVREQNDRPTIQNPFFHLSGDRFWRLVPKPGEATLYTPGAASRSPTVAALRRRVAYGEFDDSLWTLMEDSASRQLLREALIARYFPDHADQLEALSRTPLPAQHKRQDHIVPGRDAAFRQTVLKIYEHRCAACGVKVQLSRNISLVQATHLIPFGESRNDKPTNGMALCPNHHWAMDRHLIAPCPDAGRAGVWRVNLRVLDDRVDGQGDLVALDGRSVIAPHEKKFHPAEESLRWRENHLGGPARADGLP